MEQYKVRYLNDLRTEIKHSGNSSKITTDAPKDNQGLGRSFSPTDLVASSLGSCMLTIIGISAKNNNISIDSLSAEIDKEMSVKSPRMIKRIDVALIIEGEFSQKQKIIIERSAKHCPVHKSLNPDIDINLKFNFKTVV